MPAYNAPPQAYLVDLLSELQRRLGALERQQQLIWTNSAGQRVAQAGLQDDLNFGFTLFDSNGTCYYLRTPVEASLATELTTSSTSWVDLGGPSVTATVGPSGNALVSLGAIIGIDGGASTQPWMGQMSVTVDGTVSSIRPVSMSVSPINGVVPGIQSTGSNTLLLSGLAPGTHTFTAVYRAPYGQPVHFSNPSIVVIPY